MATRSGVALDMVGDGGRILDIGCSSGDFLRSVGGRFREHFGVELDWSRLREARGKGLPVLQVDLDRTGLPYRTGHFDRVTLLDVLEHVREPLPLLEETHRVLVPGGEALISTPNIRFWRHLLSVAVLGRFPTTSSDTSAHDGGHLHYFTYQDVLDLCGRAGFTSFRREPILDRAKYDLARRFFGGRLLQEFLSAGLMVGARKAGP